MAKLVDLLAKHLKEWPDGADYARQDKDKEICFRGDEGSIEHDFFIAEMAEDVVFDGAIGATKVYMKDWLAARDRLHAETVKRMSEAQCIDFDKEMIDDIAKRLFSIWTSPCSSKETWQLEAGLAYDAADAFMAERAKRLKKAQAHEN